MSIQKSIQTQNVETNLVMKLIQMLTQVVWKLGTVFLLAALDWLKTVVVMVTFVDQ